MTIQTKRAHPQNFKTASCTAADIVFLVMHFTGNAGDTARNNAEYFSRDENQQASARS